MRREGLGRKGRGLGKRMIRNVGNKKKSLDFYGELLRCLAEIDAPAILLTTDRPTQVLPVRLFTATALS
jgi:hypothetical protein